MGEVDLERTATVFHTTNWSLVRSLAGADARDYEQAAARLAERYWPAVYATLRRKGRRPEQAAEETQAFFADVVFGRRLFARARADRGRLRSLLLSALKNYQCDQHRRAAARGGRRLVSIESIECEEGFLSATASNDPDEVFEQRWTTAVIEEAVDRCARYCAATALERHWEAFRRAVLEPALSGGAPPPRAFLAEELGFATPSHLASALQVVRKRLRILIREVAAETAEGPAEQDEEYQRICDMLR